MKIPEQAFKFTPELGKRLRELRTLAGLNQAEVASRMGRHSSNLVSRLEIGKPKSPTLGLIADYLAACGASFKDVADLLDRPQEHKPKRKLKPKTLEERVEQVKKQAAPLGRQKVFEDWLFSVVKSEGMPKKFADRKKLIEYGRKLFKQMGQSRRRQLVERKALTGSGISEETAKDLEAAVEACFHNMAESGALDKDSTVDALAVAQGRAKLPRVKKADEQLEQELAIRIRYWRELRHYAIERIKREIVEPLKELGCDRPGYYVQVVPEFFQIAEETAAGSEERRARTDARVAQANDKEGVRKMAEMVYELYEKYKSNIPARPFDYDAPVGLYRPGQR